MLFSIKGVKAESTSSNRTPRPYLNYGIQMAKITSIDIVKSTKSDAYKFTFNLEGPAINDPEFKGINDAKGQVGKMTTGYISSEKGWAHLQRQMATIIEKAEARDAVEAIGVIDIEKWVKAVEPFICGKFLWWNIGGEEWEYNGKKGASLKLVLYHFVAKLSEVDASTLTYDGYIPSELKDSAGVTVLKWDRTNKYHYTPYVKPDDAFEYPTAQATATDLPSASDLTPQSSIAVDDLPF